MTTMNNEDPADPSATPSQSGTRGRTMYQALEASGFKTLALGNAA